ncbi:RIO1 family regulatory kinase/ATPase [Ignisphaera sp. 4213-co]|uniref:non-specific serine/threonine protein kinase n=1 Tax=Ignisphaera cupida TaxID=3050454 RepID=A0ABD4Z560_9CREN|nr:RIO1 family regulatory kinase/ATPase [Ignisphaera sp. 4213-co]MDK6028254.1 RIO1 family regulatory kinase/ATPase [Ignisphaera sp. 4213-co]
MYRSLVDDDFIVLNYFVRSLKRYEYVPLEIIINNFREKFTQKELIARIKKLAKMKLIERHPTFEAYRIKFLGLDCLALHRLVKKNVITAIGDKIGEGKESELFQAISSDNMLVAIKFHKIGKEFRNVVKTRSYGEGFENSSWIIKSIISGRREAEALNILNKHGVEGVPKFYGAALHSVVIEFIPGVNLYEVESLEDPTEVFHQIVDIVKNAYWKAGLVHGDLSEYNVIIDIDNNKSYIIDWPQYFATVNPIALEVLKKDLYHIISFFKRKFRMNIDLDKILEYVLEGKRSK